MRLKLLAPTKLSSPSHKGSISCLDYLEKISYIPEVNQDQVDTEIVCIGACFDSRIKKGGGCKGGGDLFVWHSDEIVDTEKVSGASGPSSDGARCGRIQESVYIVKGELCLDGIVPPIVKTLRAFARVCTSRPVVVEQKNPLQAQRSEWDV